MITISNTEISTWQRCRRKWFLTYFLGYQPATEEVTGNRILGVRVHTALEGYYGYDLDPLTVLHLLYQFEIDASPEFEMDLLTERALASAMVEGYIEWAAETGADAGLRVVATEADIVVPLPGVPGVQIRGKLDQVVLNEQTGLMAFHDWKTAASFEKHEILALDPQFRFYSMIQKLASGAEVSRVSGGMLTTLRRVKRSDKSKPPYYQRDEFRYDPVTIDSTLAKVQQIGATILAAREQLDWIYAPDGGNGNLELLNSVQRALFPPTPIIRDCGWSCPFVELCPMMDDDSDWVGALVRSGQYTQGDPYAYYSDDPLRRVRERLAAQ